VSSPSDNSKPRKREMIEEKGKAFGKYTIAGATLMAIFSVISFIGSKIGMESLSVQSAGDLAHAIQAHDLYVILWLVSAFLGLFAFVLIWSKFSHKIGLILHEKKEMEIEGKTQEVTKLKRIKIVPRILFGIVIAIMIPIAVSVYQQLTNVNLSDLESIKNSFENVSWVPMVLAIIGFAVIGYFGYYLIKFFPTFEKGLPKNLDKI
jgi:hypothetical protein